MFQVGDKVVATGFKVGDGGADFRFGSNLFKQNWVSEKHVLSVVGLVHVTPEYGSIAISAQGECDFPLTFHPSELRYATPAEIEAAERAKLPEIPEGFTRWEATAGSVSPVGPDVKVEVILKEGGRLTHFSSYWNWGDKPLEENRIIAYRVVEEAPAPAADVPEAVGEIRKGMFVKHAKHGVGFVYSGPDSMNDFMVAFPDIEYPSCVTAKSLTPLF